MHLIVCASVIYAGSLDDIELENRQVWCKDFFRDDDEQGAYVLTL